MAKMRTATLAKQLGAKATAPATRNRSWQRLFERSRKTWWVLNEPHGSAFLGYHDHFHPFYQRRLRHITFDYDSPYGWQWVSRQWPIAIGKCCDHDLVSNYNPNSTNFNFLREQGYQIRNYVYDRLSYGIQPRIDTPDIVLERGVGSCGEYVGVLLALARLNGIPCRTIGRYKCPQEPDIRNLPLEPDFNHVWLEFYVPGMGWLPMESTWDLQVFL